MVAEGEVAVVEEFEAVTEREACAEIVAAQGVVVGCAAAKGDGCELEVVFEGDGSAVSLGMKSCAEAGRFGDDGEVSCGLVGVGAVVVDVFDILVEADVEFPAVGKLSLDGADAPDDVEFANGGMVGG